MDFDLTSPPEGQYPFAIPCEGEDRHQFRLIVQPVGGNIEYTIMTVDTRLQKMAAEREWMGYPKRVVRPDADRLDKIADANRRRAKKIRLYCLELRVDRMLTLTTRPYNGRNLTREQFLQAQDLWRRAIVKRCPEFLYVGVHELQPVSGQIHFHGAIRGFLDVNFARDQWRLALAKVLDLPFDDLTGANSPGACHINPCPEKLRHLPAEKKQEIMARYICKYISSDLLTFFNKKGYFHSSGVRIAKAQGRWLRAKSMRAAIDEVIRLAGVFDADGIPLWDRCGAGNDFFQRFRISASAVEPPF
jgi:hypothetical protein